VFIVNNNLRSKMPSAITVFLIDDDDDDREIFQEALTDVEIAVELATAINGKEALSKLNEELKFLPSFIFLDLNMPIMNGRQFLQEVKAIDHLKHIPVFIYSTSGQSEEKTEMEALGAAGFITKPRDISVLVKTLAQILKANNY
jgi:CheY-like chemotaxis protein